MLLRYSSKNRTLIGLKVSTIGLVRLVVLGKNRTLIGLKVKIVFLLLRLLLSKNRTLIGLKDGYVYQVGGAYCVKIEP